jgi:hypothetical protein
MSIARSLGGLVAAALVLPGCKDEKPAPTASAPRPAATSPAPAPHKPSHAGEPSQGAAPRYYPSAHHAHRPPGYIYPDEVGENVLIAPYRRVIELFGQPDSRNGKCVDYRIVHSPRERWEFCFRGQKMTSAMVIRPGP